MCIKLLSNKGKKQGVDNAIVNSQNVGFKKQFLVMEAFKSAGIVPISKDDAYLKDFYS